MEKIKEMLKWYEQFNGMKLVVETKNNTFDLKLNNNQLPHLLGIQYALELKNMSGKKLVEFAKRKTDEKFYNAVRRNHPEMLAAVQKRIDNFKYFMENLDKAVLYEQTNKNSKLRSDFFLVKVDDETFLQLGIATNKFGVDYLETFIVAKDDFYIKDSMVKEQVLSIKRIEGNEIIPFSFNEEKNKKLLEEYNKIKMNLPIEYQNIPEVMKKEKRWAIVKLVSVEEQKDRIRRDENLSHEEKVKKINKVKKNLKIPIQTNGRGADSTNSDTWTTYEEACKYIAQNDNYRNHTLAFALGGGYVGIDIDNVVREEYLEYEKDKNCDNMTADFLRNINTYAEVSPSKKGMHMIGYGRVPGERNRNGNLEIYDKNRFFTVTGRVIIHKRNLGIRDINEDLEKLYKKYIPDVDKRAEIIESSGKSFLGEEELDKLIFSDDTGNGFSKEEVIDIYNGNWDRYAKFGSQSEADFYMMRRIAYFSKGDKEIIKNYMNNSGLVREKWNTTRGKILFIDYQIDKAIKTLTSFYITPKEIKEDKYFVEKKATINLLEKIKGNNIDLNNIVDDSFFKTWVKYKRDFNDVTDIKILEGLNSNDEYIVCKVDVKNLICQKFINNVCNEEAKFDKQSNFESFLSNLNKNKLLEGSLVKDEIDELRKENFNNLNLSIPEKEILNALKNNLVNHNTFFSNDWIRNLNQYNHSTGREYNSLNALILAMNKNKFKYNSNLWLTRSQIVLKNKNIDNKKDKLFIKNLNKYVKLYRTAMVYKDSGKELSNFEIKNLGDNYNKLIQEGKIIKTTKDFKVYNCDIVKNTDKHITKEKTEFNLTNDNVRKIMKELNCRVFSANIDNINYNKKENTLFIPNIGIENLGAKEQIDALGTLAYIVTKKRNEQSNSLVNEFTSFFLMAKYDLSTAVIDVNKGENLKTMLAITLKNNPTKILEAVAIAVRNLNFLNKKIDKIKETEKLNIKEKNNEINEIKKGEKENER